MSKRHAANEITERTFHKCANPECINTFTRTPGQLKRSLRPVCSRACMVTISKGPKYNPEHKYKYDDDGIKYIQDNLVDIGFEGVAAHFGIAVGSLMRRVTTLRSKGVKIPYLRKKEEGEISIREKDGNKILMKKEGGKMVYKGIIEPHKRKKAPPKPKPPKKPIGRPRKKPIPEVKPKPERLPDRIVDESKYIWVRRNDKTMVQVLKSIPDNKRKAS